MLTVLPSILCECTGGATRALRPGKTGRRAGSALNFQINTLLFAARNWWIYILFTRVWENAAHALSVLAVLLTRLICDVLYCVDRCCAGGASAARRIVRPASLLTVSVDESARCSLDAGHYISMRRVHPAVRTADCRRNAILHYAHYTVECVCVANFLCAPTVSVKRTSIC